jgi:hypothetical protein
LELPIRWFSSFFIGRIEGKLEGLSCDVAARDGCDLEGEEGDFGEGVWGKNLGELLGLQYVIKNPKLAVNFMS